MRPKTWPFKYQDERKRALRLAALTYTESFVLYGGLSVTAATLLAAHEFKVSPRTIRRWIADQGGL